MIKELLFSNDIGVDLGTSNVRIYVDGRGVAVKEPAVVAVDKNSGRVLQVGASAQNMLGRTPGNVVAMHPVHEGVVSDHEMTVKMLQAMFRKAIKTGFFTPKPRMVISVPSGITEVEERTVINAAIEAGARRVYLIEAPLAAALGAGLDIENPEGHMVVDVGGGTTDIAVLSMNGVVASNSVQVAGDVFDATIARYLRRAYGLQIGQVTAEKLKMQIGCVIPRPEKASMVVNGRDVNTGAPAGRNVTSDELAEALARPARQIAEEVQSVLESVTPELAADIAQNGITLTGGSNQLYGLDQIIEMRTGIPCRAADDGESCVVYGCGKSLSWMNRMNEGPINLARRRAMRGQ